MPWILVCWTVFISDIILVVISSEVNEATDDFDTLYAQCMTKLFFGSSYFLLLLKHCISFFFWGWGRRWEWYLTSYPSMLAYASPHPFWQINCTSISNSAFELTNLNKYKSSSPFRLLIADNFLALIIKHDQFWEITFLELQSILKCLFTMVKNYK